jgi:hypothetical protein
LDFGPVNDNVTQRATPFLEARQAGSVAKVPLLAGSNGQEGMNLGPEYGITNFSSVTEDALEQFLFAIAKSAALVGEIRPLIDEIQGTFPWYNLFQAGAQLYTEVLYQCVRPHAAGCISKIHVIILTISHVAVQGRNRGLSSGQNPDLAILLQRNHSECSA